MTRLLGKDPQITHTSRESRLVLIAFMSATAQDAGATKAAQRARIEIPQRRPHLSRTQADRLRRGLGLWSAGRTLMTVRVTTPRRMRELTDHVADILIAAPKPATLADSEHVSNRH